MKTLICNKPGQFEYIEVPKPILTSGHAIVKIKRVGICGTDLHAFKGDQPFFNYPRILGHELSGIIEEVDEQSGYSPGQKVSVIPYLHCGTCIACRTGKTNCCTTLKVYGVHIDGGMSDFFSVPVTHLYPHEELTLNALALIEPLAIGAHGIRRASLLPGEFVLIIGVGPIGLGAMEFARIGGAKIIAMDVDEHRLSMCRTIFNVPYSMNAKSEHVMEELMEITNGELPSLVIDATGNQKAINNAFQYVASGGRFVLIGLQKGDITFSHPEFHRKESMVMSSRNATRYDFDRVVDALNNQKINPSNFINYTMKFSEVIDKFGYCLDPANGVIKGMIELD